MFSKDLTKFQSELDRDRVGCSIRRRYDGAKGERLQFCVMLRETVVVDEDIVIVTTIHNLQIMDRLPFEEHGARVNIIVTPT